MSAMQKQPYKSCSKSLARWEGLGSLITSFVCPLKHKVSKGCIWQANQYPAKSSEAATDLPKIKQTQGYKNKEKFKWVWCLSSFLTKDNR